MKRLKNARPLFLLFTVFFLFLPIALARQNEEREEASLSQSQATMSSLFGRGAKMPGIPVPRGTMALPAFDRSGLQIDEGALRAAERQKTED